MIPEIKIKDYHYDLTDERIAKYPLAQRDSSKLLYYKGGRVCEYIFKEIPSLLPKNALMIFNDTRVVPARLHFVRESGAHIEIFCLQPVDPAEYNTAFSATANCSWKCVVGNSKRWKDDILSYYDPDGHLGALNLKARLISKESQVCIVEFSWDGGMPFSNVLDSCGKVPIPPYLNRETESIDLERYQTTYAHIRGSVAAPTAGLHFTTEVIDNIQKRGTDTQNVCLHVGAGTFLPVKSDSVSDHPMHREPFEVRKELLEKLRDADRSVVAVGTTSVRTLESLYYAGVSIIETGQPEEIRQWAPYDREYSYSTREALDAIISYLEANSLPSLKLSTRIIIVPGFRFRIVDQMVTNFHQPESTLILLISAFVGGDWRTIYDYALAHDFRFLSYGDSSLLVRAE